MAVSCKRSALQSLIQRRIRQKLPLSHDQQRAATQLGIIVPDADRSDSEAASIIEGMSVNSTVCAPSLQLRAPSSDALTRPSGLQAINNQHGVSVNPTVCEQSSQLRALSSGALTRPSGLQAINNQHDREDGDGQGESGTVEATSTVDTTGDHPPPPPPPPPRSCT